MKICTKCKLEKEESEFYRSKRNKNGLCAVCKKCDNLYQRGYYSSVKSKECRMVYCKSDKHKKWRKEYMRKYRQLDKQKRYISEYNKDRCYNDIQYRLSKALRVRLCNALERGTKSGSAVRDLGCSISFLKRYLEEQFQSGMTWENYGKWHIDHKYPLSKVDLTNREQLLKVCHYTNLQPLWAEENLRKYNKLIN